MKKKCTSQFFLNSLRFSYNLFRIKKHKLLLSISLIVTMAMIINVQSLTAQSSGTKVSFESKNQSLDQTLKALDKQTTMRISYTVDLVSPYSHISVEKGERSIESTLNLILANTNLTYEIKGDNILIIKKQDKSSKPTSEKSSVTASGKVTDKEGTPLAGVTVISQSSKAATITDYNGNYSIQVPKDDVVAFSFIGLEKKLIKIANTQTLNVTLSENVNVLDEVQVIGYGTTTRRLKTSGVATIKAEQITVQPTSTNILQSMQGKLSGVMIDQNSGGIGASPRIYVRGQNSINSGNSPLYVVDGVFITDATDIGNQGLSSTGSHSALSYLNQDDIVSIDVLKDADATAIYGSRGANGVVLVTTKRAEMGKTSFTVNASTGFNNPVKAKFLNLQQYLTLRHEAYTVNGLTPDPNDVADLLVWSQTKDYNYPKLLNNGNGSISNINGTLTGGNKNLSYLASLGYNITHDTYFSNPYDKKISGKLNLNHTSENNKFRASLNFSFVNGEYHPATGSLGSTSAAIYQLPPNFPMYNADGSYYWGTATQKYSNLYAIAKSPTYTKTVNYSVSGDFSYLLYKGLTAKLAVSTDYLNVNDVSRKYVISYSPFSTSKPTANEGYSIFTSFNIEPQLTYTTTISKAKIDVLAGTTWYTTTSKGLSVSATDYLTEAYINAYSTASTRGIGNYSGQYNVRSWFGRVNANWDNKYILNLTYRGDGSSKFGPSNRWGQFGAVGAAWMFSNEPFIKNALPWLSYGKLRGSYGVTGNDKIGDFIYSKLYNVASSYNTYAGITATLPNSAIKWETTYKSEIALENSFLNERLSTSVAVFYNRTTDLLMSVTLPSQTGSTSIMQNFDGKVDNKGLEIEINSTNVKTKDFSWRTAFNITFQKNTLHNPTDSRDGKSLNNFTGYLFSRIDPATGHALWINPKTGVEQASLDGLTNDQILGSKMPSVFGGINNSLSYKGFTLDFSISFAKKMMTNALNYTVYPGSANNMPAILLGKYWQKAGDIADYPILYPLNPNPKSSDAAAYYYGNTLRTGFYFKMQNIALSYALPTKWISTIGGQSASIYLRGQNLFYVTPGNDLGKDPEREDANGLGLLRTFVAGVTVKF
ncbi:MAG: SusC/RagA family TonB-linked outer membrane protein [Bacteroidetes bacterium]|nr:SusC/RagA family TonB-linked outer membrane protein [Bacteroidota bacterium]